MSGDLDAERIQVEAIGEPGERRFRLLSIVNGQTFAVWMEKQQVQALGLALEQMLERLPDVGPVVPAAANLLEFDRETPKQFRVGRMELGYDDDEDRIVVVAHDLNSQEDDDAAFACRMTRGQARDLGAEAALVVAAGRPRCTMCGEPMGPEPHVCPQQNGHFRHDLETVDDAEDV
ncbi:MAG: DUF3090 family protein [Chloroflexia bacterium]|nr:DUF3090 family protein [Chloroflexia bacterium]